MDMSRAFEVNPASNGGFIVSGSSKQTATFGQDGGCTAAFSTSADMIAWLAEQYGLTASVVVAGGYLVTDGPLSEVERDELARKYHEQRCG